MTIGIIDYGAGNLQSVRNALHSLGHDPVWIRDAGDLETLSRPGGEDGDGSNVTLVLPGQGEFGDSVRNLLSRGLWEPVRDWITAGRPYFGICLGYQLLFESSEESPGTGGLGIFKGSVVKFPGDRGLKIPHMGWNEIVLAQPGDPLWTGLPTPAHAYFVHSYYPAPEDDAITACTTDYDGIPFVSAVRQGNLYASQFHPEKSQAVGLTILNNYLDSIETRQPEGSPPP